MLLTRLFHRATPENPAWSLSDPDAWRQFDGGRLAETDQSINAEKALTLSPVWSCVQQISGDCSKIPLYTYRRRANGGGKDIDQRHQAFSFIGLDGMANEETTALDLWRCYFVSALLWNNGYIWIDRDGLGRIQGLYNLCPDRTWIERIRGRTWCLTEVDGRIEPLPYDDVLHLRGLSWMTGQPAPALVEAARHDFGLALAARKHTSKFFANGAQHGGILQIPPGASKEARDKVERSMEERSAAGEKAFKVLVLRDGFKFFSTTVDPDKAKLIDLDEAQVRHVARWYSMPPSRLGLKESISYNSEEAAKQAYFDTTLSYWLIGNRAQCNAKLRTERQKRTGSHVIRYQINALLWADAKARSEIADRGIQTGRFSPDETRDWEGMNPRPDGEGGKFLRPLNSEAVGQTTADGNDTDDSSDDTPAARQSDDRRGARRRLLVGTLARAVRRLAVHGTRAAKRSEGVPRFLERLDAEHAAAVRDMLADVAEVCCGDVCASELQRSIFDAVDRRLKNCDVSHVADAFDELTESLPAAIAADYLDGDEDHADDN